MMVGKLIATRNPTSPKRVVNFHPFIKERARVRATTIVATTSSSPSQALAQAQLYLV